MWTETHALRYAAVMCRVRSWTCTTPRPHSMWVCASLQLMVARLAALEADNYVERNDDEADSDEWVSDSEVSLSNRCPRRHTMHCLLTHGWVVSGVESAWTRQERPGETHGKGPERASRGKRRCKVSRPMWSTGHSKAGNSTGDCMCSRGNVLLMLSVQRVCARRSRSPRLFRPLFVAYPARSAVI